MPAKITSKQETRITDLVRDAIRALDFSKDEAREIITNGGVLQTEVKPILRKLAIEDKRFGLAIKEFDLTVPADYDHDRQIDQFAEAAKKLSKTYYYNNALTSSNFAKATKRLEPGKTYRVKIFPILERVTSEDCLDFYRKQKALLVGGQGLTLAQSLEADEFPVGKWTISFDEKGALWTDAVGGHRVPGVCRRSDGGWLFDLGFFEYDWLVDDYLLCFCDL